MKELLRRYGGFFISAFFVYWIVFQMKIDFGEAFEHCLSVSFVDILILIVLYLIPYPIRAVRAAMLLPNLDFFTSLGGVFVGYAANNVLPFRLGEVVRAQVVGKRSMQRRTVVLSSVLIERIFDGVAIVMLLLIGASTLELPSWATQARLVGLLLFGSALVGMIVVGRTANFWRKWFPKGKLGHFLEGLLLGVESATRTPGIIAGVTVLSFIIWILEASMYWYGFKVFSLIGTGKDFQGSMMNTFFVLGIINLGVLLPSSPGFIGVFEFFAIRSLSVFGVPKTLSAAYAIVVHIVGQFIPVTIIGAVYMAKYGLNPLAIAKKSEPVDDEQIATS